MEAGYIYLDRNSTRSSKQSLVRSQTSSTRSSEADRPRRGWSQRLFPHNAAAGDGLAVISHPLVPNANSTQASSVRSKSVYSQDSAGQAEDVASNPTANVNHHQRNESLRVKWTEAEVIRMAGEIYDGSIHPVCLSLLGIWICESHEHYEMATAHIRELALDQGYSTDRIKNEYLRELLISTRKARPEKAREKVRGRAAPVVNFEPHADEDSFEVIYSAKLEVLPSSVRKKPESAIEEDKVQRPLQSPIGAYPPNTPDRPHPLSLRTRNSGADNATPTPYNRSVPTQLFVTKRRAPLTLPRHSVAFEEVTRELSRLTSATTASSRNSIDTDDVFGITDSAYKRRSDPFDLLDALKSLEGKTSVPTEEVPDLPHDNYELASLETSSMTEQDTRYGPRSTSLQGPVSKTSVLESTSTDQAPKSPKRYIYTSTPPSPAPTVRAPDPPVRPSRGKAKLRQRISQWAQILRRPNLATGEFYQPALFPGSSGARREADNEDGEIHAATLARDAMFRLLAGFPIPLVTNPVSTLPMLVSAATNAPDYTEELADQIRSALEKTRARGDELPLEDWKGMSHFEKAWRQANEDLLIWVFGRQDTLLEAEDVASVGAVGKEVRACEGHWVVELLREGADVF